MMASGPIISWQIDGETMETVIDFIFLDSKITADSNCSRGIKRHLLLERKAMISLDSVSKSRDITLPTKVCIVKADFSSRHVWRWELDHKESWSQIDAFKLWCWKRLLGVPWAARRSNKSILKEINPEYSMKGLMLKLNLQYYGHLMRTDDLLEKTLMLGKIEGKRRKGWQMMRRLDSINSMDMN